MKRSFILIACLVAAASAAPIQGTVLDAHTRQPVPFAEVHAYDIGVRTNTDKHGRFIIETENRVVDIEVSRIGYRTGVWYDLEPRGPLELHVYPIAINLEGVTVSAFRVPVAVDQSGPVSVIDLDRAETGGRTDVAGALRSATSAWAGDYTNFTSLWLRGAGAAQSLVALDGVRLNSPQTGTFDLTTLPLTLARRLEIARGPGSALYGSSPVGGVINILTPDPGSLAASVRGGLGSHGRRYARFTHSNFHDPLGYFVAGNLESADNDFEYDRASHDTLRHAETEGKGLFGKGMWRSGPHQATLLGEYNHARIGTPGFSIDPLFPRNSRREDIRGLGQFGYSYQASENDRTEARAWVHRFWQNYQDSSAYVPVNDTHDLASSGIQAEHRTWFVPWGMLMLGAEASSDELLSSKTGEADRSGFAAWTQLRIQSHGFALTPILRAEQFSQVHSSATTRFRSTTQALSPKLALTWSAVDWLSLYAGAGRSFRAPTFNDLYWPESEFEAGNPFLEPERAVSFDAGIAGRRPDLFQYWVGWFRSGMANLIQWQPDTIDGKWRPVNVDSAVITGLEAEISANLEYAGLDGNLCFSSAQSGSTRLYYRPELLGRATLWGQYTITPVTGRLSFSVEHTGNRLTDPADYGPVPDTLPAYTLLHAEASLTPSWRRFTATVRGGIRNLLDVDYQTVRYYPLPGRTWFAELELGI